jgi:hypothetical protein
VRGERLGVRGEERESRIQRHSIICTAYQKLQGLINGNVLERVYSTHGKMSYVLRIKIRRYVRKESPRRPGISRKVILKNDTKERKYANKKMESCCLVQYPSASRCTMDVSH